VAEQREENDFARWVAALQQAIIEQERALFSETVLREARHPQNMTVMLEPDGHALVLGPCGDTMEIFLRIRDSQIESAAFMTDGCGPTVACGSMLTQMVQGKSPEEAGALEAAELIIALDGLPPEHIHCATLAVDAFQKAVKSGHIQSKEGAE
jgi:nitrogen fixation protein NifU and related proteins